MQHPRDFFKLPADIVREIITGNLNYEPAEVKPGQTICEKYFSEFVLVGEVLDRRNEFWKSFFLPVQEIVNNELVKGQRPFCYALRDNCLESKCPLYSMTENGFACREYRLDFVGVSFDRRFQITDIGIGEMDVGETLANLQHLKELGAKFYCPTCSQPYAKKPLLNSDSGIGKSINFEQCQNGRSDHSEWKIDERIKSLWGRLNPKEQK